MGLGVLEDKYLGNDIPGTSVLNSEAKRAVGSPILKRSKNGVILVPQPSDSPNDPLNWPQWRKMGLMLTITFGSGVAGAFGPIIGAGLVQVAAALDTTVPRLSEMTGDNILAIGLVLLLVAPASVVWGRRPTFILGNLLMLISGVWSAVAVDVTSLTIARIIGGMGMAPIECLVQATVADIFFVHERGTWIAVWSFAILGGVYGVSIVNGYLIQETSFRVCFWIESALILLLFILTWLFVPETAFRRDTVDPLDLERKMSSDKASFSSSQESFDVEKFGKNSAANEVPFSFLRRMRPVEGTRFVDESFWTIAKRPFTLLCSPIVIWGTIVFGTTTAWIVMVSVSVSLLFSSPQFGYNFQPGPIGLISGVGPFIAAVIANLGAGPASDRAVQWMARKNGGVYEPEFRLVMIVPMFFLSTIGWFGWAISASIHDPWIAPAIFYSLISFGQSIGGVAVISYVVDAHDKYAPETFAAMNACKSLFVFGVTYFAIPWLTEQGVLKTFITIGGFTMFVCILTIPMYIYGKRARSWVCRTPWLT